MATIIAASTPEQRTKQPGLQALTDLTKDSAALNRQNKAVTFNEINSKNISTKSSEKVSATVSKAVSQIIDYLSGLLQKDPAVSASANISYPSLESDLTEAASFSKAIEQTSASAPSKNELWSNESNDESLYILSNKDGTQSIYTEDGYIIKTEGKDQAWTITDQEGRSTRIWGDPHVVESDGDNWDFKEQSSFLFGNNKITIETVPYNNDQTLTSRITVYNGSSRVSISGIDLNKPVIETISADAIADDALRNDGDVFVLSREANGDERFILTEDRAEKFDPKFAQIVGADNAKQRQEADAQKKFNALSAFSSASPASSVV